MKYAALITGASSGIGYELAKILAREGYDVVLVARRQDKLTALQQSLEAQYAIEARTIVADLTEPDAPQQVFDTIMQWQWAIAVLVNNAGFGDHGLFLKSDWSRQQHMIQLNILALTHLTHLFLPGMVSRSQGQILNVASTAAFQPGPLMSVYFASKAYVLSFTEAIANELKGTGVTATTLCPGPTQSEFATAAGLQAIGVEGQNLPTSAEVAEFGYRAMQTGQTVVVHGLRNRVLAFLVRFLPRNTMTQLVRQVQEQIPKA
jgi:short-subunit dehydrogenase